ncbi:MAG: hypothetical protein GF350_16730 [Chitinivibrionales bacterium]|nr:hypothetical protein [Chitinivibrionales bacterium]
MFPRNITKNQSKDTGMAMVLISMLLFVGFHHIHFVYSAIGLLIITMVWPVFFRPLGYLWFGMSIILGTIVSKIILTAIFYGLVTPLGVIKRMTGSEPLQLKKWKKQNSSYFHTREITFSKKDIEKPY